MNKDCFFWTLVLLAMLVAWHAEAMADGSGRHLAAVLVGFSLSRAVRHYGKESKP